LAGDWPFCYTFVAISDFIAREIVGHDSAAVSRQYTHLTTDDKRAAMQRLPDVTEVKTD
jgi:hypothetical protein